MRPSLEDFFATARERYRMHLLKDVAQSPAPWTLDPVMARTRLCNVHREDDKTTAWFRENLRAPLAHTTDAALLATVVFRWFNRVPTGEVMLHPAVGLREGWFDPREFKRRLLRALPSGPWVTGAYMVKTPAGMNKIDGLLQCIGHVQESLALTADRIMNEGTLEAATRTLAEFPYLGTFMAYEIVTDLRHTLLLWDAPDIRTWASPGPGCARGIGLAYHNDAGRYRYQSAQDRAALLGLMADALQTSRDERYWPADFPAWEMREVEHWACEYAKIVKVRGGQAAKRSYP